MQAISSYEYAPKEIHARYFVVFCIQRFRVSDANISRLELDEMVLFGLHYSVNKANDNNIRLILNHFDVKYMSGCQLCRGMVKTTQWAFARYQLNRPYFSRASLIPRDCFHFTVCTCIVFISHFPHPVLPTRPCHYTNRTRSSDQTGFCFYFNSYMDRLDEYFSSGK